MIPDFAAQTVATEAGHLFMAVGGSGPPVLLLHGFPETHLMWREIAPRLAEHHSVVCADLRGYGDSACPPSDAEHRPYGKRAMAIEMVAAMATLGHQRFAVAGHDRGGRLAYRMALDHPDVVTRLAVFDVVPTGPLWERADARLALAFWPFSLLAQPAPLPERLIGACPEAIVGDAITQWGSPAEIFTPELRAAYVDALRGPAHVHAICEEYRAAASIDREDDAADIAAGRRIVCPLLALWSATGGLGTWYAGEGGPLAIWRLLADDVRGEAVPGGHFFPEEHPRETADRLARFFDE